MTLWGQRDSTEYCLKLGLALLGGRLTPGAKPNVHDSIAKVLLFVYVILLEFERPRWLPCYIYIYVKLVVRFPDSEQ